MIFYVGFPLDEVIGLEFRCCFLFFFRIFSQMIIYDRVSGWVRDRNDRWLGDVSNLLI